MELLRRRQSLRLRLEKVDRPQLIKKGEMYSKSRLPVNGFSVPGGRGGRSQNAGKREKKVWSEENGLSSEMGNADRNLPRFRLFSEAGNEVGLFPFSLWLC